MRLLEAHIEVSDLDKSVEFYTALLPHKKLVRFKEGDAAALVFEDGSAFGLWMIGKKGIHGGEGGRHLHFAFQIPAEEYDAYKQKLEKLGVEPLEYDWPSGAKSVYFFDRDGHQGEFMTTNWFGLR